MMVTTFWHVLFLIGMGLATSTVIFLRISALETTYSGSVIPLRFGWKLLFFGTVYGFVDYIAGVGMSVNKETIL